MSDSMTEWIAAYFDDELSSERRAWVEDHLAVCADCRRELEDLRALSGLLHTGPAPVGRLSDEAFTDRVLRRLPPPQIPFWIRAFQGGLRYAPLGLFGLWAFSQAVIIVSGAVLLMMGLFPSVDGALQGLLPSGGAPAQASLLSWFQRAGMFFYLPTYSYVLSWIDGISLFIILELGVGVVFAALFMAWMAGYWSRRRFQMVESFD